MSDREADERLVDFYTREYSEAERLTRPHNRLEFIRTQQLLRQLLPPRARILDVGGGTGVHADWLSADGHDVTLIDVVPEHVRAAARSPNKFEALVGDARSLEWADASVDVCLLLGPLYHLPAETDRALVLREAARVTRPGGYVVAAAISRFAWPLYTLRDRAEMSSVQADALAEVLRTGVGDPIGGIPSAYSHTPDNLVTELADVGLTDVELFGIEGPGWIMFTPDLCDERTEELIQAAVRTASLYDGHPATAGSSTHMLAIGKAQM